MEICVPSMAPKQSLNHREYLIFLKIFEGMQSNDGGLIISFKMQPTDVGHSEIDGLLSRGCWKPSRSKNLILVSIINRNIKDLFVNANIA